MRDAVRFFRIAFGLLIGIILIFYFFSDLLSSRLTIEILIIVAYGVLLYTFYVSRFQSPILKNKIILRLKKYNWIYLILWSIIGLLRIHDGYTDSDTEELLFGFIKEDYAYGFGFILLGFIFLTRTIIIDKKGIRLNDSFKTRFDFSHLDSIVINNHSIELQTLIEEHIYKIQELTDQEIIEINNKIETIKKSTIAQQCV
ncbi:hypothetical protein GSB9_03196 [Flavobacteriaceae bacterium GSB9]|nr:hypothetical protein GSB9_03196 [Flavobacteriaceae bacterium GSB9]